MVQIAPALAEAEIIKAVEEVNKKMKLGSVVNEDCCPGVFVPSQVQLSIMGMVERALKIKIPENCYLFFDKATKKKLSIKEAAQKLISKAVFNG